MKNTHKITAFILFAAALAMMGCKKDKLTSSEILTAGTCWKMVLLEGYDTANSLWVSVPIEACAADNCFVFNADQTLIVEEGLTKCDPADAQSSKGSWSLSEDERKLSMSDDGDTQVGDIIELISGKLVYETALDDAKFRLTFKAD